MLVTAATIAPVLTPADGDTWLALTADQLVVGAVYDWAVRPDCGAVVLFSGTVRDHADGREGVTSLSYEAYEEQCVHKFAEIAGEIRTRWPDTGRVAILHRFGTMTLNESTVLVVISSPHRPNAFEAARFGIDALKATAPIWKHEEWQGGSDWGTRAQVPQHVSGVSSAPDAKPLGN